MDRTFRRMAEGAAMQTGTTVEVDDKMRLYAPVKPHPQIDALLLKEFTSRKIPVEPGGLTLASTDFGNVSQGARASQSACS